MRAVMYHQGALGDFLMAASAMDELAGNPSWTRVDFWSKPEHVSLLTGRGYLGECHSPEGPLIAGLLHEDLWRSAVLPGFLLEADHLFIFGQSGSRLMAQRLSERLAANVHPIQSFPVEKDARIHVTDFLRGQLNDLGWPISCKPLALSPPRSEIRAAKELLHELGIHSRPVFVHPGSGGRRKIWPLENWHGLLHWIRRKSLQAVFSIGPADEYMLEFSEAMKDAGFPVASGLSLLRLSALLSLCGLFVGSDSGVSHLAAAVGIPAIIVFGPTDPRVWAPRGSNTRALRRKWKEEDVFKWTPQDVPDFRDEEICRLIGSAHLF